MNLSSELKVLNDVDNFNEKLEQAGAHQERATVIIGIQRCARYNYMFCGCFGRIGKRETIYFIIDPAIWSFNFFQATNAIAGVSLGLRSRLLRRYSNFMGPEQ